MTVSVDTSRTEALVERIFEAALSTLEIAAIHVGDRLGFYRSLDTQGPATSRELASATGTVERYVREWLEQQAVAGLLEVVDAPSRRCALAPDHARVLVHEDDPAHIAPFAHMLAGIGGVLPRVAEAYRTGGGVPYEAYGAEFRHGQGHINRPAFTNELPGEWLDAMPDVALRLRESGARVADVGCGQGWSSVAVAREFPLASVHGFDADPGSIADARRHAREAGVDDRVRFFERDATAVSGGPYDLVMILETLHDLPRPVDALRAARAATAPAGTVLVVDERVAESFSAPGDEVERTMYGWSVTHCLPTQMVDQPSAALGTVIRSDTVRECAFEAGYAGVDVLPVENDFFRLYRLHP
jgi:2-polyprenyl-3-methyl-5-hydroxy-6-metoxy-1,4-benzoquinol methylase